MVVVLLIAVLIPVAAAAAVAAAVGSVGASCVRVREIERYKLLIAVEGDYSSRLNLA